MVVSIVNAARSLAWLLLFALGTVSVYASRSVVAILLGLALLAVVGTRRPGHVPGAGADPIMLGALLALLAIAGISAIWSGDPASSLRDGWRIALVLVGALVLIQYLARWDAASRSRGLDWLAAGVALGTAVLLFEWALGGRVGSAIKGRDWIGLGFTSHASAVLVLMIWPAAAWIWRRRGAAVALSAFAAATLAVVLLPLAAGVLALIVGGTVWLMVRVVGRGGVVAVLVGIWLLVLGAPALFSQGSGALLQQASEAPQSWRHRLVIWDYFSRRISERPLLGYGLSSAHRSTDDPEARAAYEAIAFPAGGALFRDQPPLHPHNSVLQLWHDLGLAGVLCLLVVVTRILAHAAALPRSTAAWICAALTSWLIIACISFGLWQKWWLAAAGIAFAVARCVILTGRDGPGHAHVPEPAGA